MKKRETPRIVLSPRDYQFISDMVQYKGLSSSNNTGLLLEKYRQVHHVPDLNMTYIFQLISNGVLDSMSSDEIYSTHERITLLISIEKLISKDQKYQPIFSGLVDTKLHFIQIGDPLTHVLRQSECLLDYNFYGSIWCIRELFLLQEYIMRKMIETKNQRLIITFMKDFVTLSGLSHMIYSNMPVGSVLELKLFGRFVKRLLIMKFDIEYIALLCYLYFATPHKASVHFHEWIGSELSEAILEGRNIVTFDKSPDILYKTVFAIVEK